MSDCQYGDFEPEDFIVDGTHHMYHNRYRQSSAKIQQAVDTFNAKKLDFVIHLGDFVDRRLDDADVLLEITNTLKAPFWHVLGNHDFVGSEDNHIGILQKYSMESPYYSRSLNGLRLIVLDTNELSDLKHPKGTDKWQEGIRNVEAARQAGKPQAYAWNGGVDKEQMQWLDSELTDAANAGEKAILFSHHQVFPPSVLCALNNDEILDMIDRHPNVISYINGHNHLGAFGLRKGVPYVTMPGMLQGETNAFGIVHVYDDRIEVDGYDRVEDMTLEMKR